MIHTTMVLNDSSGLFHLLAQDPTVRANVAPPVDGAPDLCTFHGEVEPLLKVLNLGWGPNFGTDCLVAKIDGMEADTQKVLSFLETMHAGLLAQGRLPLV